MTSRPIAVVVVALLVAGGYWLFSSPRAPAPAAPSPAAPQVSPPAPSLEPVRADLPLPEPAKSPTEGYIAFPDGTFYPPLNGVKTAPKVLFHPRLAPFAKVTGKIRDASGREWYVHENGVQSTTYVNSAGVATFDVQKPMPAMPVVDEAGGKGK